MLKWITQSGVSRNMNGTKWLSSIAGGMRFYSRFAYSLGLDVELRDKLNPKSLALTDDELSERLKCLAEDDDTEFDVIVKRGCDWSVRYIAQFDCWCLVLGFTASGQDPTFLTIYEEDDLVILDENYEEQSKL